MAVRASNLSTAPRSLSRRGTCPAVVGWLTLALLGVALALPVGAEELETAVPERDLESSDGALFSIGSPIGPFEYTLGRGLRVGDTGLNIGGYTTVEFDRADGKSGELELDGVNFLVLFEPNEYIRGFLDLEIGDLFIWQTNESVRWHPQVEIERVYGDLRFGDALGIRVGKFQTPIGRFNLIPAEPFIWTPVEPAFLEITFDEHQTGGAFLGSLHTEAGSLDYWLFGQFLDALDPSEDPVPTDHSIGGRPGDAHVSEMGVLLAPGRAGCLRDRSHPQPGGSLRAYRLASPPAQKRRRLR